MLDFNHLSTTPGLDVQYFQAEGNYTFGNIASVTIAANGVLTVTAGSYSVGQAIYVTGTFSAGSISGYNSSGTTYYIISVNTGISITISATPGGAAVTSSAGVATPGGVFTIIPTWQTWVKPRGVKNVYIFGAGGGASGAIGANSAATNAGGAGGGSGALTSVYIPAIFVPDVLYVMAGSGGKPDDTLVSGVLQKGGGASYVCIEPITTPTATATLFYANGGAAVAVTGGAASTLANMPLAGRGQFTSIAGQNGGAGGTAGGGAGTAAGGSTGIILAGGGGGGGGGSATGGAGGGQSAMSSQSTPNIFLPAYNGGAGASGGTPAGAGVNGILAPYLLRSYGGAGGGGCSNTLGGVAGAGGNGAPGSGGGGSGGASTTLTTLARPGRGGPGFIYIFSW